jgi:hypothetical protein
MGDLSGDLFSHGCIVCPRVLLSKSHPFFGKIVKPNQSYGMIFWRLIEQANFRERNIADFSAGLSYWVQRGEVLLSVRHFSSLTGVDKSTLSRVLKAFQAYGLIRVTRPDRHRLRYETARADSKMKPMNIITICNYEEITRFDNYSKRVIQKGFETPAPQPSSSVEDKTKEMSNEIEESIQKGLGLRKSYCEKTFDEVFNVQDYGDDIRNIMPEYFLSRAYELGVIHESKEDDLIYFFYERYWISASNLEYRPKDWMAIWISFCRNTDIS